MLKATLCCMLIAATAAMAWDDLPNVPSHAAVDHGTHLIWGGNLLWGLFPTESRVTTYLNSYDPTAEPEDAWDTLRLVGVALGRTGIAFQSAQTPEPPVVWVIGNDVSIPKLIRYNVTTGTRTEEVLTLFSLGIGAAIAYQPNEGYNVHGYPVPGWLYFLPGNGTTFYRHWIPATAMPDPLVYGYEYPGDGVTIADPTPPFRWSPATTMQYRIQVATDSNFGTGSTVIDQVVNDNQYQPTAQLTDTTYYWRVASWSQGQWFWDVVAAPRRFCLHPGWDRLPDIGEYSGSGAKLAFVDNTSGFGHNSIVCMYNQGYRHFAEYNIGGGYWTELENTPKDINDVSSLTTNPFWGEAYRIYASFDDDVKGGCPHYYDVGADAWYLLNNADPEPIYNTHYPDDLSAGSSMAIGANNMMYLTTGVGHDFWDVDISIFSGGQQARNVPSGKAEARALTVRKGLEIEYQLPVAAHVRAILHDALGRRVGALDAGEQAVGRHRLCWHNGQDGRRLSAGAYFVTLDMGNKQATLKAVIE